MTKEELNNLGWEIVFAGPCEIVRWGRYMILTRHLTKGAMHGYGSDEQSALEDIRKNLDARAKAQVEAQNEVAH